MKKNLFSIQQLIRFLYDFMFRISCRSRQPKIFSHHQDKISKKYSEFFFLLRILILRQIPFENDFFENSFFFHFGFDFFLWCGSVQKASHRIISKRTKLCVFRLKRLMKHINLDWINENVAAMKKRYFCDSFWLGRQKVKTESVSESEMKSTQSERMWHFFWFHSWNSLRLFASLFRFILVLWMDARMTWRQIHRLSTIKRWIFEHENLRRIHAILTIIMRVFYAVSCSHKVDEGK